MGVLSLQGWRGESDCVNISEHDTKKTDCGTSATHPDTHKTIVTREWNRSEHIGECYYHAQLNTVSSKRMLAEHLSGSVID